MLKSPSGVDLTGLARITAGNVLRGVSNPSIAHTTNVPCPGEQKDPFAGLPFWGVPTSREICGAGTSFWGLPVLRCMKGK